MSVVFAYSHTERERVDTLAIQLEDLGYDVILGPLGLEVGTRDWSEAVQSDIERADCVLLLLTRDCGRDPSVAQRCEIAAKSGKRIFLVQLEEIGSIGMLAPFIRTHQMLLYRHGVDDLERALRILRRALPKSANSRSFFLSYSRADSDFSRKLVIDLRGHHLKCWRDVDDIPAGATWDQEIEKALQQCSCLLLVWSKRAVGSTNVSDEIGFARDRKKRIIPLLLDDTPLALRVHRWQAVGFSTDYSRALGELLSGLAMDA